MIRAGTPFAASRSEILASERVEPLAERWLRSHADAVAGILVTLGCVARVLAARVSFLLPDDMLHLEIAKARGILGVYHASLASPHPPLFMLLLHFWKDLARSPFSLRLLSVAFGTAFLWVAYRWASSLLGKSSALTTLALLAFLPSLVALSAEIRGYALLLLMMAAALTALERALEEESPGRLGLFAAFCGLALLTHYAALWFLLSSFVYGSVRLVAGRAPRRFARAWVASQAAIAAFFAWIYVSHVSKVHGGAWEREAQADWLRASYFHAGQDSPLRFLARQTVALFQFFFSSRAAGILALAFLLGGIAWLAARRQPSALLLGLPFLLSAAAGLLNFYPYGGTRHSADLMPFACAAIGVGLSRLSAERFWVPVALAAVLAPAGFAVGW